MSAEMIDVVRRAFQELELDADVSEERCDGMVKAVVSGRDLSRTFQDSTALHAWINTVPNLFFVSMSIRGDVFSIYWSEDD